MQRRRRGIGENGAISGIRVALACQPLGEDHIVRGQLDMKIGDLVVMLRASGMSSMSLLDQDAS
jgi:hypothetical protein